MKRSILILLVVCSVAALAGWGTARMRSAFLERRASRLAEDRRAAEAEAKIPARQIATLIREADQVVISYSAGKARVETDFTFDDPAWRAEFAHVIARASFKATPHSFWISTPSVSFNRNHAQVLELMSLGGVLRALGGQRGGDFVVGVETVQAIHALVQQKRPDKLSEPWHG
jgi:hypothetical protein